MTDSGNRGYELRISYSGVTRSVRGLPIFYSCCRVERYGTHKEALAAVTRLEESGTAGDVDGYEIVPLSKGG